ncbi:MAG: DUF6353 family protein [Ruminococcus sp.]|nr:DUF6353 family protein [Ruminococcus sp.]
MNKEKLSLIFAGVKNAVIKHCPEILTGMGIAGMLTAGVLAVKATPKAMELIEEKKARKGGEKLTVTETVSSAGLCYLPSIATAAVSAACIIGASTVHNGRNAALAAAYALSEKTFTEYKDKVLETVGEKKDRDITDAISKDKMKEDPVTVSNVIFTNSGNTLCYDVISGRYFTSDIDKMKRAVNELNRRMRDEMFISLNELYVEIGLNPIPIGENVGWNIDKGYIDLYFSSQLTDDNRPCIVVNYTTSPKYGYGEGMLLA